MAVVLLILSRALLEWKTITHGPFSSVERTSSLGLPKVTGSTNTCKGSASGPASRAVEHGGSRACNFEWLPLEVTQENSNARNLHFGWTRGRQPNSKHQRVYSGCQGLHATTTRFPLAVQVHLGGCPAPSPPPTPGSRPELHPPATQACHAELPSPPNSEGQVPRSPPSALTGDICVILPQC